jgi:hypothetical protein
MNLAEFDKYPLPQDNLQPDMRIGFGQFLDNKYKEGKHNLYIVWLGNQALYVGIAKDHIRGRWLNRSGQSHMYFAQKYSGTREGGSWVGLSTIGRVIQRNLPESLQWTIELRHYSVFSWSKNEQLEDAERRLIGELRPLFNVTYRDNLTDDENKLVERLEHGR